MDKQRCDMVQQCVSQDCSIKRDHTSNITYIKIYIYCQYKVLFFKYVLPSILACLLLFDKGLMPTLTIYQFGQTLGSKSKPCGTLFLRIYFIPRQCISVSEKQLNMVTLTH